MNNLTLNNRTNQYKKSMAEAGDWVKSNGQFAVDVMSDILGARVYASVMRVLISTTKYYGNDFFLPSNKLIELTRTSRRTHFRATAALRRMGWISTNERTTHNLPRYHIHWDKVWGDILDYLRGTNKFSESVVPSPSDDPFDTPIPSPDLPQNNPVDNLWKNGGFSGQSCQNGTTHLIVLNNNINNNTLLGVSKSVDNSSNFTSLIPFSSDVLSDDEWMQIGEEADLSPALVQRAHRKMTEYYAKHPARKSRSWAAQWRKWLTRYKANLQDWWAEQNRHQRTISKPRYRTLNTPQSINPSDISQSLSNLSREIQHRENKMDFPRSLVPADHTGGMTKIGQLMGAISPVSSTFQSKEIMMSKASATEKIPLAPFSVTTPDGAVRDQLLKNFGQDIYVSWFQNAGISVLDTRVTITVSNAFKRDYIQREYLGRIKNILKTAEVALTIGEVSTTHKTSYVLPASTSCAPSNVLPPNNTIVEHAQRRLSEKFGDFYELHIRHAKLSIEGNTLNIFVKNEPQRQILWNNYESIVKVFNGHITNLIISVV